MADNKEIQDARRRRLAEWIKTHFDGKQSAFIAKTGINQGELSGLLKAKSFAENKAIAIEKGAGMPDGYLRNPTYDAGVSGDHYVVAPAVHADGDVLALQMAFQSLITALQMSAPIAARDFAVQLRDQAEKNRFSVDRGLLAALLRIAEKGHRKAAKGDAPQQPRGSAAKAK